MGEHGGHHQQYVREPQQYMPPQPYYTGEADMRGGYQQPQQPMEGRGRGRGAAPAGGAPQGYAPEYMYYPPGYYYPPQYYKGYYPPAGYAPPHYAAAPYGDAGAVDASFYEGGKQQQPGAQQMPQAPQQPQQQPQQQAPQQGGYGGKVAGVGAGGMPRSRATTRTPPSTRRYTFLSLFVLVTMSADFVLCVQQQQRCQYQQPYQPQYRMCRRRRCSRTPPRAAATRAAGAHRRASKQRRQHSAIHNLRTCRRAGLCA